jgi:hypothetical protein
LLNFDYDEVKNLHPGDDLTGGIHEDAKASSVVLGTAVALTLTLAGCSSMDDSTSSTPTPAKESVASSYYPTTTVSDGIPVAEDPFEKCEDHDNFVVTYKDGNGRRTSSTTC